MLSLFPQRIYITFYYLKFSSFSLFLPHIFMQYTLYPALVLVVSFMGIISGFRNGITSQFASLLGFAFGVVAARVIAPDLTYLFIDTAKATQEPEFQAYTTNLLAAVFVFSVTFFIFSFLSPILKAALSIINIGMFNRLIGVFFSLLKYLLWLSIALNLLLCFRPDCGLLRFETSNDGNLVAAVLDLTPACLGCFGAEDFAHFNQLKEAKSISCNFNGENDVILSKGLNDA